MKKTQTIYQDDGTFEVFVSEYTSEDIYSEIESIEYNISPRRLRESFLTKEGMDWLTKQENKIIELRKNLNQIMKE